MAGLHQKAGERAAERLYTFIREDKGKDVEITNVSKGLRLEKDRIAPERTAIGIRNQMEAFTHPTTQKIINDIHDEDRKARLKKGKGEKAAADTHSAVQSSDKTDEGEDGGEDVEDAGDYMNVDTLMDADGNFVQDPGYFSDQEMDEDLDALVSDEDELPPRNEIGFDARARGIAQATAAEAARVTGRRQAVKDLAGPDWLRGG